MRGIGFVWFAVESEYRASLVHLFEMCVWRYSLDQRQRCASTSLFLRLIMRGFASVGRYGGEEFVVILSNANVDYAEKQAERVGRLIEELSITHEKSEVSSCVTVSQGVCSFVPSGQEALEAIFQEADILLYEAKQNGRNQFVSNRDKSSR